MGARRSRGPYARRIPAARPSDDPPGRAHQRRWLEPSGPTAVADPGTALSIHHVFASWRDLERQLERLVTDRERAADIRLRIAQLRALYRSMADAAADSYATLADHHDTIERAYEIVRRHVPRD